MKVQELASGTKRRLGHLSFVWEDAVFIVVMLVIVIHAISWIADRPAMRLILNTLIGVAIATGIWALVRFRKTDHVKLLRNVVFPAVLAMTTLLYTLTFTPASVPDEQYHFCNAYEVANILTPGMELYDIRATDAGLMKNEDLFTAEVRESYWKTFSQTSLFAESDDIVRNGIEGFVFDIGTNLPQFRLPSALGIVVGRLLGLSGLALFLLGRLCNAAYGAVLLILAVRIVPRGKNIFMTASLLPMTLHLLSSYSYDVGYVGLAFVAAALLLRMNFRDSEISVRESIVFVVIATLLTPGKIIYVLIPLLALFVPASKFASKKHARWFKIALVVVPLAVSVALRFPMLVAMTGAEAPSSAEMLNHRGSESGHFYTIASILSHPLHSIRVFCTTIREQGNFYFCTMLGGSLGWFQQNLKAGYWQVGVLALMLLLATIPSVDDDGVLGGTWRRLMIGMSGLGFLAVVLSMWIGWTFDTEEVIQGVQGRYLLPYLPAFLLGVRSDAIVAKVRMTPTILMVMGAFNCFYLSQIFYTAITV